MAAGRVKQTDVPGVGHPWSRH